MPDGLQENSDQACQMYEQIIRDLGGIDLQLLGLGHNGHIGFNEPAEDFPKITHCVDLTESTIQANKRFFEKESDVPRQAYTCLLYTSLHHAVFSLDKLFGLAPANFAFSCLCS